MPPTNKTYATPCGVINSATHEGVPMPAPAIQPLHHASQLHIDAATPMGANVVEDDATFRAWARGAVDVYVITSDLPLSRNSGWTPRKRTGCFAGMTERGRVSSQAWWTARLIVFTRGC